MFLSSKFDLGQRVYLVRNIRDTKWHVCQTCDGSGMIYVKNEQFSCPSCHGSRGRYIDDPKTVCSVSQMSLTIGMVRAEARSEFVYSKGRDVTYMCLETGVGSGSVYYECDLFATLDEAKAECQRRNEMANK